MYSVKKGVKLDRLHPSIASKLTALDLLWQAFFPEDADSLTITSGHEGSPADKVHLQTSFHYTQNFPDEMGRAIDLRVKDVPVEKVDAVVAAMKLLLGTGYDVVWGAKFKHTDHIHIEYDPA